MAGAGSGGFRPSLVEVDAQLTPEASVLASEHGISKRVGITLDSTKVTADGKGNKIVPVGTVLIRNATSGKYEPYTDNDPVVLDGHTGILVDASVNLKHGDVITGLLLHGSVLEARLKNLDAAAKTFLANRIIFQ